MIKRVMFLTNGLGVGGAEKLLVDIINRLDLTKIKPIVVSIKSDRTLLPHILPDRAEIFIFPRSWRYDLSPAWKIRKLIVEKEIDVIVPFAMFEFFYSRLATLWWKKYPPTRIYIHTTKPPTRKWFIQDWIYSRLLRPLDRFITVCNAQAAYWSSKYGIPFDKFTTVYGGVDVDSFDFSRSEVQNKDIRREHGISFDAHVIVQVANFHKYKLHEDALRALKVASEQCFSPLYLLWVGGGDDQRVASLKRQAQELGISGRVIFCGKQQDVRPFLFGADLFTLTSNSETFSISALEAMAMGIPCVLTDIGGAREMIVEGQNGFVVQAENPTSIATGWLKIIRQPDLFKEEQIRNIIVNHFSTVRMVQQFEDIICSE